MKTLTDAQVDRAKLAYSKRATQGGEASFEDCIRAALATLTDNPPRAAMNSLSVGWLEWVEPFGPNNEPVFMRVPYATAIARSKANASANWHTYDNDEQALDDFRAVNWTNECNASSALI